MRVLTFIWSLFKKFPLMLSVNTFLQIMISMLGACSLLAISPLVDLFINPDLVGVSPITIKAIFILKILRLPVTLGSWSIVFVAFVTLTSLFRILADYYILKTRYIVTRGVMSEAFEDFFQAGWYFFSSSKQGMLLNTFTNELNGFIDALGGMAKFFAIFLQLIFYALVPFYISWQTTTISLFAALLFAAPLILLGKVTYQLGKVNTVTRNKMVSVIHENFNLAKLILGFGNQKKSINNFKKAFDKFRRAITNSQTFVDSMPSLYRPFGIITVVIALFAARHFDVALSEIMVLLVALYQVATSIGNLTANKHLLEKFFPSFEQIKSLQERAIEFKQFSGNKKFTGFKHELLINGLSFLYPGHNDHVLADINVQIPKGNMIAIVGESGSGKSTLIDLILGLHKPTSGHITFDSIPLVDFDTHSYRSQIGYVPQDSVLFNESIRNNLLWSNDSASNEDIVRACRLANADEFINQLIEGYDTVVGDRGIRLSGGQVQRIALARAILRKPELLILDEATSALDTYSERLIQEAIENIAHRTTVIIIAHRLSTIVKADRIYVLKKGG